MKLAVILLVVNKANELLLIKRNKKPKKWSLIGGTGAFKRSENLEDMVQEEAMFDLKTALKNIKFFDFKHKNKLIELYFYGELKNKPAKGPEVSKIKWFKINEIKKLELAFKDDKTIIEKFFKSYTRET